MDIVFGQNTRESADSRKREREETAVLAEEMYQFLHARTASVEKAECALALTRKLVRKRAVV